MVFLHRLKKHKKLAEHKQKKAGSPVQGSVGTNHQQFLEQLFALLDSGEVDPFKPSTALKHEVYNNLDEDKQAEIDLELQTICGQIRLIESMRKQGGDLNSVHFHSIVEHLWDMVNRIEVDNDVFKF